MNKIIVSVPATTANLGVGFDCLGAALSMANEFQFALAERNNRLNILVEGEEADKVSTGEHNLAYRAVSYLYHKIGQIPPNLEIKVKLGVPLARGLGSSATAIVGGLLGANSLMGNPFDRSEIAQMAIAIEGHPDNVVPALMGNCLLSVAEAGEWQICPIAWHQDIIPVVAIPDFELSTKAARSVLPNEYSRGDAIFNISRMGLLLKALETNNGEWLRTALADKLHQPYRQQLIKGYDEVRQAAMTAGAYGVVISGAGPTLLALTNPSRVEKVATSMTEAWSHLGVKATVQSLTIDRVGAKIS